MAFGYFNKNTGYSGQDLHVIRNGKDFPLNGFFDTSAHSASYDFKFPGTGASRTYENITISTTAGTINASAFTSTTEKKIGNFFVEVSIDGEYVSILVHIHDSIEKVWATPSPLTFRKNMSVRFGLYAKFNGNYFGDISFYPQLSWAKIDNNLSFVKIEAVTQRLVLDTAGTLPTALQNYPDSFEVTIPDYFKTTGSPQSTKASMQFRSDQGSLELILGRNPPAGAGPVNIDNGLNILFLADGFDGQTKANLEEFKTYVRQIRDQMSATVSSPWNLFPDINFWAYYLESREPMGILRGEFLKLSETSTVAKTVSVNRFIEIGDAVIEECSKPFTYSNNGLDAPLSAYETAVGSTYGVPIINFMDFSALGSGTSTFPLIKPPSGATPKMMSLSKLCGVVGLPSQDDIGKNLAAKKADWLALGLTTTPYSLKFPGDTGITSSDYFVHNFVFHLWLKLASRIVLDLPDTALGIYRGYEPRKDEFVTPVEMDYDYTKFKDWDAFGKFISVLKYPNTDSGRNFGDQFYDANGAPVFSPNDDVSVVGTKTITTRNIKHGNNVLALSRVHMLGLKGVNQSATYTSSSGATAETRYTKHRVVASLHPEGFNVTECDVVPANAASGKPLTYKPKNVTINSLKDSVKNTIIHEFSHNWLLDEYTSNAYDLGSMSNAVQEKETEYFAQSNIQTRWSLLDSGDVSGNKIKWLWPRVSRIGVSTVDLAPASTSGQFVIELKAGSSTFVAGEFALLRRKKLFGAQHIHCSVVSVDTTNPNKLTIKAEGGDTIDSTQFKAGSVLIFPYWDDTTHTGYQELVHPKIKLRITKLKEALVPRDLYVGTYEKQEPVVKNNGEIPDMPGRDPVRAFRRDKARIVGLYAGAVGQYAYDRGAYHPTGFCIMRQTKLNAANYFCHVCRYILVDAIDPLQHIQIDVDYQNDYPTIN